MNPWGYLLMYNPIAVWVIKAVRQVTQGFSSYIQNISELAILWFQNTAIRMQIVKVGLFGSWFQSARKPKNWAVQGIANTYWEASNSSNT